MLTPIFLLVSAGLLAAADNFTSTDVPSTTRAGSIEVVDGIISTADGRSVFGSSIELMYGEASAAGNAVADIALINAAIPTVAYTFPASLPAGPYHFRFNATTNTSAPDASNIQQITTRSSTIPVTSAVFTCASPPQFKNVTSPTSSPYTSLRVISPLAGDVETITTSGKGNAIVTWGFRDDRNAGASGIDKFTMEIVRQTDSGLKSVATVPTTDPTASTLLVQFAGTGVVTGTHQIRINYTNAFADGPVQPGGVITSLSEPFFVAGDQSQCFGVAGPGKGSQGKSSGYSIVRTTSWVPLLLPALTGMAALFL